MSILEWVLNLIGVAICTQIHPIGVAQEGQLAKYDGYVPTHIVVNGGEERHISLQKLTSTFSLNFKKTKAASELDYSKGIKVPLAFELPFKVPVLDQGQYGTCVTFASTATADQVLGGNDTISQQCSLELDVALGSNYWNGADYSSQVLQPLKDNGIVAKDKCPQAYPNSYAAITVDSYKALVDSSVDAGRINYQYFPTASVDIVKSELAKGHYINAGFGLQNSGNQISVQGYDVVVAGKKYSGGLWSCKQGLFSKNYCGNATAGHEIVIYGYDDAQQVFRVRNSWSSASGYQGDFFITYAFFTSMAMDVTSVWGN